MKNQIRTIIFVGLSAVSLMGYAHHCKVHGYKIDTHHVSCEKAKKVLKGFLKDHTPKGWHCDKSEGECKKGDHSFTFKH